MPRVHKAVARYDYPDQGIVKGQTYYWWQFYRQGKTLSATYPKRSQLTQREELRLIYDAEDACSALQWDFDNKDSLADELRSAASTAGDAAEAAREKASNIEQYFQGSEKASDLENFASECDDIQSQLETLATEVEDCESEEDFEALDEPSGLSWPEPGF